MGTILCLIIHGCGQLDLQPKKNLITKLPLALYDQMKTKREKTIE